MKLQDFQYSLDPKTIAHFPFTPRDSSKLLIIDRESWIKKEVVFKDIYEELTENDVLIFNETKVIKARLKWYVILKDWREKEIEVFLLKHLSTDIWECSVYPWERLKAWKIARFRFNWNEVLNWTILETTYSWRIIRFNKEWEDFYDIIDKIWEVPLPPYIEERNHEIDRYNTVFAKVEWSAAAPTAWLHFTQELIESLKNKWVKIEKVILHVGLWTFKTITSEEIEDHQMHYESISIDNDTAERLNKYKKEQIIAVWTTVVRTLESMTGVDWIISSWEKDTNIFIYPWYRFKFVDNIITNFHLPWSSLLMLISAFYNREKIIELYKYAQENNYRFFSFGDAMFIR